MPGARGHEESKRRYEELTRQWLQLAEQRQRCARVERGDIGAALISAVKALFCDGHHIAKPNGCLTSTWTLSPVH
jgi:hypothetical protein